MLKEMAEKAAKEKEIQIGKLEKQLVARTKELEKVKTSMIKPEDLFRTDEFKEWDEAGVPITMANQWRSRKWRSGEKEEEGN